MVCLLGPSGVGKTQLFRCISGLQRPTSGEVLIGADQKQVQPGDVGVVPQQYTLFRHRKVLDNLLVAAAQRGTPKAEAKEKAMGYLKRFGIEDRCDLYPAQLSGGQRQRVAIIQQLLSSGHFLLMDEPFSGLDPINKDEAIELIGDVSSQDELNTIVVTTHDVESAITIADQLVLLGRNEPVDGKKTGSSIKKIYDLAAMGMAWRPTFANAPSFSSCRRRSIRISGACDSGAGDFQQRAYLLDHTVTIRQHIVVPETDDRVAVGFQDPCAGGIALGVVLPAVQLDHQPRLLTDEIPIALPAGCCRLNLAPSTCRLRRYCQSRCSASVPLTRRARAIWVRRFCGMRRFYLIVLRIWEMLRSSISSPVGEDTKLGSSLPS